MSRILRNFRVSLLQEKNVGGYLIYAFGEIVLIVVGILVALWIDNWNEGRQVTQREQFYLAGLQKEFEQNRVKLQNLMEANRSSYQMARELADHMARSDANLTEARLSQLLFQAFSEDMDYQPNNSLLNEMINSGRLEILSLPELRGHLTSWASRVERIQHQEENLREQRNRNLDLARTDQASIRSILEQTGVASATMGLEKSANAGSNEGLLRSREFENNTLIFILTAIATEEQHYQPLLEEIDTILSLLEREISD